MVIRIIKHVAVIVILQTDKIPYLFKPTTEKVVPKSIPTVVIRPLNPIYASIEHKPTKTLTSVRSAVPTFWKE